MTNTIFQTPTCQLKELNNLFIELTAKNCNQHCKHCYIDFPLNKNVKDFYNGKIIPGIELNTKVLNIPIEILGYGIDYAKMNNLVKKVYIPAAERNFIEVKRLYKKCIEECLYFDSNLSEQTKAIFVENSTLVSYPYDVYHGELVYIVQYTTHEKPHYVFYVCAGKATDDK